MPPKSELFLVEPSSGGKPLENLSPTGTGVRCRGNKFKLQLMYTGTFFNNRNMNPVAPEAYLPKFRQKKSKAPIPIKALFLVDSQRDLYEECFACSRSSSFSKCLRKRDLCNKLSRTRGSKLNLS